MIFIKLNCAVINYDVLEIVGNHEDVRDDSWTRLFFSKEDELVFCGDGIAESSGRTFYFNDMMISITFALHITLLFQ
jgi:hypothetical protein